MKKVGHFFFALVPFLLTTIVQYCAVFFGMGISALSEGAWYTFVQPAHSFSFMELSSLWSSIPFNTVIMIVYATINIAVFGIWYYVCYEGNILDIRRTFHPMTVFGILLLMPGTQYLTSYLVSFVSSLFPQWLEQYMSLMESAGMDSSLTVSMFCYSVLFAPISEELIFRGVTLRQARRALPFWAANILQAVLFGVFHMNLLQGIYAFFLGLILGYVCHRGGSLSHAILLHILFNFWGTVISQFITIGNSVFSFLFWLFFSVSVTVGGLLLFRAGAIRKSTQTASNTSSTPPCI